MAEINNLDENVALNRERSNIQQYFEGATIFITGATGFLGQLLLEKLLRTCSEFRKVYLLIRPKSGKSVSERLNTVLADQMFDRMKREQPNFMEKVSVIRGEFNRQDLGLNPDDKKLLVDEVNCIFHCAGSVCLDEKLRIATYVNVRATRDLVRVAKIMKCLKSFICVSSAFSHCPRRDIDEEFYKSYISYNELLTIVDALDDVALEKISTTIIGKWPNTHTFTKAVAEDAVKTEGLGLPLAIIRPSMVIATAREPVAGWIDNLYGPTGLLVASNLGITRSTLANPNFIADVVPADYVVNALLASAWHTANLRTLNENKEFIGHGKRIEEEIPIYNIVSSPETPITWGNFMGLSTKHASEIPSMLTISHGWNKINSSERWHYLYVLFLHYIPGIFVDLLAYGTGKPPLLTLTYKKIDEFTNVFKYFTLQQWFFRNKNTQELWKTMNAVDKLLFEFDMSSINWDLYYYNYMRGIRVYVLKDPLETVLKGCAKYMKLKILHYVIIVGACFLIYKMFRLTCRL